MCNLYSLTKGQAAIQEAVRAMVDHTGNLPSLPGILPDYAAPIVRNGPDGRELAMARWGMLPTQFALKGKRTDPGVTNIRNTGNPRWRRWLGLKHRCVVPFTSFSEKEALPDSTRPPVWQSALDRLHDGPVLQSPAELGRKGEPVFNAPALPPGAPHQGPPSSR